MENKIRVTGNGAIHVVPDVTRLEVTVSVVFKNYEEAYLKAKMNSEWMVKILEYNELNGKLAKTTRFDISEHEKSVYEKGEYVGKKKDGYLLSQRMKIDLDIDNVLVNKIVRGIGKYIEGAQINIGYTVRDPRPHKLKMLQRAVCDAEEKAKIMAEALHCKLGKVLLIDYSESELHIYSQARCLHENAEACSCSPNSLDITPEDLAASDDVTVEWELTTE